jgi:DHA1 family tetracycline resistance protein-like MFS transporter
MSLGRIAKEFSFVQGNLLILLASWTLMNFASSIPDTYYSLYVLALGGTEVVIGIIGFTSFLILAFIQFPGGYLADKHGRRWLIVAMTFGVALTYVIYAIAQSWYFILIAAILQNIFLIYQPALTAMAADSIPPRRRGVGFSLQTLLNNLAGLLGPTIAGVLYASVGLILAMRVGYSIAFVFFIVSAVLRTRLQETLKDKAKRPKALEILGSYPRAVKESVEVWRCLPKTALILFLVSAFLQFFALMCSPFLVVYATKVLAIDGVHWAMILALIVAMRLVSALPIGKIVDKYGRRVPLALSLLLLSPSALLFIVGDFARLLVFSLLFGIGNSMFGIAQQSLQADLLPREHRGKAIGCIQSASYILSGLGQLVGGVLYRYSSPQAPFLIFSVAALSLAVIAIVFIREPQKREE